jgi:MFS family permease
VSSPSSTVVFRGTKSFCRGIVGSYGAFQTYYELDLLSDKSPSDISWIGSLQAFLLLVVGVLTGPFYDWGYFRALIFVGCFLEVFGMMMLSLCKAYWEVALAQALVVGVGCGCSFIPSVAILPSYFSTKKGLVNGIAASGSGLGMLHFTQLLLLNIV